MARKVVKQVRIRGRESAKELGGLDINLSLELDGKEYFIIPYYANGSAAGIVPGNLFGLNLGKKKGDFINFSDDDFIKYHLDNLNAGNAGAGSYLNYISVPADKPVYPEGGQNYSAGKVSKNVYSIIQDPFDVATIPEEDEDLKARRKLWDEYNAAKDVAKAKPPVGASSSNSDSALSAVPNEPTVDPKSVTGKLFVKKKSGPGEIMGVTELEILEAKVIFKDFGFVKYLLLILINVLMI